MTDIGNKKFIAYLTLLSGLSISAVAIYYSVVGLTAIFAAAVTPIIVMGVFLELSKLIATLWLKQNWSIAPFSIKVYLLTAISILMFITSIGIFGFLSKSHSDQGLIGGEIAAKLSLIDEKIKISKENIETARRALKQLDESVEQVMSRSSSETGADKAVNLRRSQSRERARLISEIDIEQKKINNLNEERAPIMAQVRQVEAEVGPLKYIAAFIYEDTDQKVLEKAVTWIIILIVLVFDPLAVVLLLASQISFQNFREKSKMKYDQDDSPITENQIEQIKEAVQKELSWNETHPYLFKKVKWIKGFEPVVYRPGQHNSELSDTDQEIKKALELQKEVDTVGYSSQDGIVKINGQIYPIDQFERLINIAKTYKENSISQEEYLQAIKNKNKI